MASIVPSPMKIAIIICSVRPKRAGPQIGSLVLNTLRDYDAANNDARNDVTIVDLANHPLPMYSEPGMPVNIDSSAGYALNTTKNWSKLVGSYDAFVFVTPEYNGSYPASVKLAIDYLYTEWNNKPAMVISYGGRGGTYAASHLCDVLRRLKMRVVESSVSLSYPDWDHLKKAAMGEDLQLGICTDSEEGDKLWYKELDDIVKAYEELLKLSHEQ